MITNIGKGILAKYLIGQAPAYASYIAVGCGAKPINTNQPFGDYSAKESLDFEMFRVPIVSRGYVNDNGIEKIVLTAELPTDERYEISEVGIFSAGANPSAGAYDSRSLFAFTVNENWEYHDQTSAKELPIIYSPLDDRAIYLTNATVVGNNVTFTTDTNHGLTSGLEISIVGAAPEAFNITGTISSVPNPNQLVIITAPADAITVPYVSGGYVIRDVETGIINQLYPVFQTNSDNKLFTNPERLSRYERARFFNNVVMMQGDTANLGVLDNHLVINSGSNHIHLLGTSLDFNKNSPTDQIKLAFSIINKDYDPSIVPDEVRILLEFADTDTAGTGQWARFEVVMSANDYNFATNRYYIITKQLQELYKSTGFTWNNVSIVKIYTTVINNNLPSSDFYVGLDAIRFENTSTTNPIYGLTGYTVLKNTNAETIVKSANTANYIEFRFAMDVQ